jgi:predicted RNA-binding Zn ribbon-like protein
VSDWDLVLALVSTVRHDGNGGVADDLDTVEGLAAWLATVSGVDVPPGPADEATRVRVVALRRAIRSLFARAVHPQPPSRADAARLLPVETALEQLNAAAAGLGGPGLRWPVDGPPRRCHPHATADPVDRLLATLAGATIGFLTSAAASRLRACPAPRCVRYFLPDDPRQAWCKPSCGNRARVARHYQRHHAGT